MMSDGGMVSLVVSSHQLIYNKMYYLSACSISFRVLLFLVPCEAHPCVFLCYIPCIPACILWCVFYALSVSSMVSISECSMYLCVLCTSVCCVYCSFLCAVFGSFPRSPVICCSCADVSLIVLCAFCMWFISLVYSCKLYVPRVVFMCTVCFPCSDSRS